ncbi:Uncharacterized protein dnm_045660 [Desulfonema magnum]|uniref:Uncharacterized protein n=1 Tax=Desulfonema magnum TaxID=45655 RepID=A0A975BN57_9BACT|nr:Uncharacterized protein dnm_045660 [Desulfonema magnum]
MILVSSHAEIISDSIDFTVKIHFENPGFLSENIFMTGGEKSGFFMSVYMVIAKDLKQRTLVC